MVSLVKYINITQLQNNYIRKSGTDFELERAHTNCYF